MLLMETHIGLLYFSNASMVDARSETKTKRKPGMQDQYSKDVKVNSNRRFNIRHKRFHKQTTNVILK